MKIVISPLMVAVCDAALLDHSTKAYGANDFPPGAPIVAGGDFGNSRPAIRLSAVPGRMSMSGPQPIAAGAMVRVAGWVGCLLIVLASSRAMAQAPISPIAAKADSNAKPLSAASNPAAASLEAYLSRVRQDNKAVQTSSGAIWTDAGRLTRMSTDVRAMRPHDLISVVVYESLAASTDGTVKSSRASNANSSITGLIGALHAGNALQNLVSQTSSAGLNAQGTSATNSSLSTTFGGQVVEVLPNGMLVIEAARQVEFSQQTQTIMLRGLVRPEDISQQNQVLSTAISSMELQVRGKGIVNDYTHRQNLLVRLIERVLVF